jgi:UDP-glucuronate 4-epimerase
MRALVTGGAGFIGSSLATRLADEGHRVVIADSLTPYYDPAKSGEPGAAAQPAGVRVVEVDLVYADLDPLLGDVDVVFHQSAQPGVRRSWDDFGSYATANITVTQRLLDAVMRCGGVQRFVYASSSSVARSSSTPSRCSPATSVPPRA